MNIAVARLFYGILLEQNQPCPWESDQYERFGDKSWKPWYAHIVKHVSPLIEDNAKESERAYAIRQYERRVAAAVKDIKVEIVSYGNGKVTHRYVAMQDYYYVKPGLPEELPFGPIIGMTWEQELQKFCEETGLPFTIPSWHLVCSIQ